MTVYVRETLAAVSMLILTACCNAGMLIVTACCNPSMLLDLQALAAVAADDAGRLAVHEAGGVPLLIKLMDDGSPNMVRLPVVILYFGMHAGPPTVHKRHG